MNSASVHSNLDKEAILRYAYIRDEIRSRQVPGDEVVEFGAAPGDQIAQLQRDGFKTTALDIGIASDEWGSGDAGRMIGAFNDLGVTLIKWNLEEVPYPLEAESFDAVILTEVFEHLREYPIRSLQEAHRVLKPGGRLYFTTPNSAYLLNCLKLLCDKNVSTPLHDWIGGLPFARHSREYTFHEIVELRRIQSVIATA